MLTWPKIALALLQVAELVLAYVRNKQQMDAGVDKAIAKSSASILLMTQAAKGIEAQLTPLTEAEVDAGLKDLEPK